MADERNPDDHITLDRVNLERAVKAAKDGLVAALVERRLTSVSRGVELLADSLLKLAEHMPTGVLIPQADYDRGNEVITILRKVEELHPPTEHGCKGEREIYIGIRNDEDGPHRYSEWSCSTRDILVPQEHCSEHEVYNNSCRPCVEAEMGRLGHKICHHTSEEGCTGHGDF